MALTPQQERFAQLVIERPTLMAAYRGAYNVSPDTLASTVASAASEVAGLPEVAARIQELRDKAAAAVALPSLEERIKEQREIERADPREIIGIHWTNCRYCHGIDHHYQWADDFEYARAVDEAIKLHQPNPDMSGGMGFNANRDPVADCTGCWGVGVQRPYVADTRKLSRAAARLYKGVKIKADGSMELLLHDQQKYTDMLNRIQGAYKDGAIVPAGTEVADVQKAKAAVSAEERQRGYLRVVAG